jgi:dipeptidyl aminopeptidase/acylaminoacyl peptidase
MPFQNRTLAFMFAAIACGLLSVWLAYLSRETSTEERFGLWPAEERSVEDAERRSVGPPDEAPALSLRTFFDKPFDGRDLTVGRVLERHDAYVRYYVTYRSGELTISGIMNVPAGDGPFPVLILNHGYIDPDVYANGRGLRREQDYLARQGFVVIHPDYRNHAQSSRTEEGELENRLGYVEDVINAVVAVRESSLPYLDKERIGMLGHSMGGGIAETVAVARPDLVKAVVLYAPVSMDLRDSYFKYMAADAERAARVRERYGAPEDGSPVWDALSPKTYADRIVAPILLFQGTRDTSVPPEWSDATAALLRSKGKSVDYVLYPGEGHEFGPRWPDFMARTTAFFRERL